MSLFPALILRFCVPKIGTFMIDVEGKRDNLEKNSASLFAVSLDKPLKRMLPSSCGKKVVPLKRMKS